LFVLSTRVSFAGLSASSFRSVPVRLCIVLFVLFFHLHRFACDFREKPERELKEKSPRKLGGGSIDMKAKKSPSDSKDGEADPSKPQLSVKIPNQVCHKLNFHCLSSLTLLSIELRASVQSSIFHCFCTFQDGSIAVSAVPVPASDAQPSTPTKASSEGDSSMPVLLAHFCSRRGIAHSGDRRKSATRAISDALHKPNISPLLSESP